MDTSTTIPADIKTSLFESQVILNNSCLTSFKNPIIFINFFKNWQERRDSNPQPPVLETGALPLSYTPTSNEFQQTKGFLALGIFDNKTPLSIFACSIP